VTPVLISDESPPQHLVVVQPGHGWRGLGLRELIEHRELLYFFVWRDLKVRYKQTFFGVAWAVMQPLLLMAVFSLALGRLAGVGSDGVPYPLFVFAGLVPWTMFAQSLAGAANSLIEGEGVLSKVYFPRLLMPFAAAVSFVVDFLVAMVVLVLLLAAFGVTPTSGVFWLPAFTLMALVASLGVGTFLAAINVRYRDVRYVVPFLIQLWLFASPVVYSSTLIPERWRAIYSLNPMAGVIDGFRWALFGEPSPQGTIFISAVATAVIFVASLAYFRRVERTFADVI
jgi:lipopolysaccharide transport system permease protein